MTKKKSFLRIVALCLIVCLCFSMAACNGKEETPTTGTGGETTAAEKATYTIEVKTEAGAVLEGIGVYVYEDATKNELVTFAKTDASGKITFTDVVSDSYIAVLDNVPEGYEVQQSYPVTGTQTLIVLAGTAVPETDLENITYKLGDILQDYTFTAADGTEYTISQLLKQKKAVVLNFWFVNCQPCRNEFPYLQAAYERFGSEIEVLALNPVDTDAQKIADFQSELGLTFPMMQCDPNWEKAMQISGYPTTVVIDRYGVISLIHTGTITEAGVFEDIFTYFTADDYEQGVVENMEDLLSGSNADTPIEIGGVTSFEVTVKPGKLVYYNIYKVTNMYLQIRNSNAYAIYNGYTYNPSNGVVGFTVTTPDTYTPAAVAFGNSGTKEITYTVTLSAFQGSSDNPYTMSLGQFEARVNAGNDQGVYFEYTAEEEGQLTLKCLSATRGVNYDFAVYNTDTGAFRTLAGDVEGDNAVTVKVYKGDYIRIIISTLPDSSNNYPSATFTMEASFSAGENEEEEKAEIADYAVTVTDENRKPVSGTYLYVDVDGTPTAVVTDEKGVAHIKLEVGTYKVSLAVPEGYTARTTQFRFTETRRTFSVKLDTVIIETETYTVKTVDENGAPVANVLVTIGSNYGYTDANGLISFTLDKDSYTAVIGVPEGYLADTVSYSFPEDTPELTVALKKGTVEEDPEDGKLSYTVQVVDYNNKPKTELSVQFLKDGTPIAVQAVDAEGKAAVRLEPGDYTVALASSGVSFYYDETAAVLSAEAPSVTITVAEGVSGEPVELYVGKAYNVNAGGTYVKLQSGITNYFLFEPTEPGLYQFTTSDVNAVISYWGGSTVGLITDQTGGTDYDATTNTFTRNIKQSNIGMTCIIGITGEDACVLEITRIGDPILDETDIVPETYAGKTTPTSVYTVSGVSGKSLTYIDLTSATESVKLVYSEADGFYHLNSANGPVLYMNLGTNAPYVSMYTMLGLTGVGGTSFTQTFYDENGTAVRREDYTICMQQYAKCIDATYGVYPLTEDLIYMLQQGGDYKGWWDSENGNYLFADVENLNQEIAWMFAVCYFG